jgi:cell division protein FtsI/penicillin-binding protein 2
MTAAAPEAARSAAPQAMSEQHTATMEIIQKRELWRFWMLVFGFGILTGLVAIALFVHQVIQFGEGRPVGLPHQGESPRGSIVDRNGVLLAADRYFYEVSTTPNYFDDDEQRQQVADLLQGLAGIPALETFDLLRTFPDNLYLRLAESISMEAGHRILDEQERLADEPGIHPLLYITLTPAPQRYYPEQRVGAHLLGIMTMLKETTWRRGLYGVEGFYESYLRQRDGVGLTSKTTTPVSSLPADVRRYLPSVAGRDLILTIDRNVQWIAEEELARALELYKAQAGTIIVMEPKTGEVLAMANAPTFDPNAFIESDPAALQNPAVSAQYEPGSVFKVITAAAALDSGVVTPTQKLTDTGSIAVGDRVILNSDRAGGPGGHDRGAGAFAQRDHGTVVAVAGHRQFYQYLERFGFGKVTEIDLAGEVYGLSKRPARWTGMSDLGTNSFGQGWRSRRSRWPTAVASLANGGKLMRPMWSKARVAGWRRCSTTIPTVGISRCSRRPRPR